MTLLQVRSDRCMYSLYCLYFVNRSKILLQTQTVPLCEVYTPLSICCTESDAGHIMICSFETFSSINWHLQQRPVTPACCCDTFRLSQKWIARGINESKSEGVLEETTTTTSAAPTAPPPTTTIATTKRTHYPPTRARCHGATQLHGPLCQLHHRQ